MTSITGPGRERTKIVIVPGPPGPCPLVSGG